MTCKAKLMALKMKHFLIVCTNYMVQFCDRRSNYKLSLYSIFEDSALMFSIENEGKLAIAEF